MAQCCANPWIFVGCHADPKTGAAADHRLLRPAVQNGFRSGMTEVGVIDRRSVMRAEIKRLVPQRAHLFGHNFLERKSGVIGGQRDDSF
jgi:hypothetical protein